MSEGNQNESRKRKRETGTTRKWTPEEDRAVCEKLKETILSGSKIEQPTAKVYYEKMAKDLNLQDVNHIKLKAKVHNLKTGYMRMIDWRSKTGQGVMESGGDESVRAYILSKCPLFDLLDEVFASKANVNPPFTVETGTVNNPIEDYQLENEDPEMPAFDDRNPEILGPLDQTIEVEPPKTSPNFFIARNKRKPNDGISALAEVQKLRMDVMQQKVELEKQWRSQQFEMEEKKLELEKTKIFQSFEMKKWNLSRLNASKNTELNKN